MAVTAVEPSVPGIGRRRLAGLAAGAMGVALLVVYVALWLELPGSFRTGNDFAPTYVVGQYVLHGQGASVYDEASVVAAERAAGPSGAQVALPFISPPAAALLFAPLSRVGFRSAETVYSLVQLLGLLAAAVLVVAKTRWPATTPAMFRVAVGAGAVGAPTVGALLLFGESDGLFTLAVTASYLLLVRRHPVAAGLALGVAAGFGKPHLLIGVLAFLLFRRAVAVAVTCVATAVAVNVVAVVALGPTAVTGFISAVLHSGTDHLPSGLVGMTGLVSSWLGNDAGARLLGLIASAAVVAVCARLGVVSRRTPARTAELLAAVFALTLLCSPHLLTPDVVVLVPAFVWLYAAILSRHFPSWRPSAPELLLLAAWAWLGVATVMDAGNGGVGFPGRVTSWGLVLFAYAAWRASTTGRGGPGWRRLGPS